MARCVEPIRFNPNSNSYPNPIPYPNPNPFTLTLTLTEMAKRVARAAPIKQQARRRRAGVALVLHNDPC